MAVRPNCLIF